MKIRGFELVSDKNKKQSDEVKLPKRGSKTSAGYDFYTPIDVNIEAGKQAIVWTDIKAYMQDDEVLQLYVRSSIGIKKGIVLSNGTGIVDHDYYNNDSNEGNIGIALINNSDKTVNINAGERIAQGIFMKYLVADQGNSDETRTGGIGSTDK